MKKYFVDNKYKSFMPLIPDAVNDAIAMELIDVKKLYTFVRCKELLGKRIRYKVSKIKSFTLPKTNIKMQRRYTIHKIRYQNTLKGCKKQKDIIKEISNEVGLQRARIYDYSRMDSIYDLINAKDFFYIYCLTHLYDDKFFELVFQDKNPKVNRYKEISQYIFDNPNTKNKGGWMEYHDDNDADKIHEYKEDAMQKYFKNLQGCVIEISDEEDINKTADDVANNLGFDNYAIIESSYSDGFSITVWGEKDDGERCEMGGFRKKIKTPDKCLGLCNSIRNQSKNNKNTMYLIYEKELDCFQGEYVKKAVKYLSSLIKNLYIIKEK